MTAQTDDQPTMLRPTMAERRAAKLAWEARNPVDQTADLVCVYDQDETVENQRTKEIVDVVRVRRYARKRALQTDVAVRYDDEPIRLYETPVVAPPKPRMVAIMRKRPPTSSEPPPAPVPAGTMPRWRGNRPAR